MNVSVALCTYNGEKFLNEQLNSFLWQSHLPDELVVCDDCSTDSTLDIIRVFAETAPFIVRLYQNENNLGSTKNFEKAINYCEGDIIFLSDQDDVWTDNKISRTVGIFEDSEETLLVFTNGELVNENLVSLKKNLWKNVFDKKKQKKFKGGRASELLKATGIVTGATICFRKELKEFVLPIPVLKSFIHDGWIALIAARIGEVDFLDENLIKYRQHSKQQIGASPKKVYASFSKILSEHKADLIELNALVVRFENRTTSSPLKNKAVVAMLKELRNDKAELVNHLQLRANLPRNLMARYITVFKEVKCGNYHRFGRGLLTACKDLSGKFSKEV